LNVAVSHGVRATGEPWVRCVKPCSKARLRLFCFPYAGGGRSVYRAWPGDRAIKLEHVVARCWPLRIGMYGPLFAISRQDVAGYGRRRIQVVVDVQPITLAAQLG